jgi:8-hydroxy-5-deazaflavin:NADPH oxidoreductase
MKIGIIGAGHIGGTLARRLTALGHQVFIANSRGPATLAELAAETGATPVSVTEAARAGELVVVTIPEKNITSLPRGLFRGMAPDVVVVDTGHYYPQRRDGPDRRDRGRNAREPLGRAAAGTARGQGVQ